MADKITDDMVWMTTTSDKYPQLVTGGVDKTSGETLYVGRSKVGNSTVTGKVYKGLSGYGLYAAEGGDEHFTKDYEMLVTTVPVVWVPEKDGGCPPKAIPGGTNSDGNTMFIARAKAPDGGMCPGMLFPPHKKCVYSFQGKLYEYNVYEVLAEKGS